MRPTQTTGQGVIDCFQLLYTVSVIELSGYKNIKTQTKEGGGHFKIKKIGNIVFLVLNMDIYIYISFVCATLKILASLEFGVLCRAPRN